MLRPITGKWYGLLVLLWACVVNIPKVWAEPAPAASEHLASGQVWSNQDSTDGVLDVAFSPDGKSVASASADGTARIFDAMTGKVRFVLKGHSAAIPHIMFCGDGTRLATGGVDGEVRVWGTGAGDLLAVLRQPRHVHSLTMSRDGKRIASGGCDNIVRIWDVNTEKEIRQFQVPALPISLNLAADGRRLLVTTLAEDSPGAKPRPGTSAVWVVDPDTGATIHTIDADQRVLGAAFTKQDGKLLVYVNETVQVFDAATYKKLTEIEPDHDFQFPGPLSPDLRRMVSSKSFAFCYRDVQSGKEIARFRAPGKGSIHSFALSPDGRYVVLQR